MSLLLANRFAIQFGTIFNILFAIRFYFLFSIFFPITIRILFLNLAPVTDIETHTSLMTCSFLNHYDVSERLRNKARPFARFDNVVLSFMYQLPTLLRVPLPFFASGLARSFIEHYFKYPHNTTNIPRILPINLSNQILQMNLYMNCDTLHKP